MRLFAGHVERLPSRLAQAVRAGAPEEVWRAATSAGVFSWLPIEVNFACTRAVALGLGAEDSQEFFRSLMLTTSRSQLLGSLMGSLLRVTSNDPSLALAWLPKGSAVIFRNLGTWLVLERGQHRAVVELRDVPLGCFETDGWVESVVGALRGLGALVRLELAELTATQDVASRRIRFEGTW